MQTDMTVKDKATRLWAIMGLCSLGLCITACDEGEMPAGGKDPARVELRLSTSISDSPSTKAGSSGPTITTGKGFAVGTNLGLFVTREEGGTALAEGSDDNMKSTLTNNGTLQEWSHTDKNGTNPIQLAANNGESINFAGYSPWIAGASATAVPFDLSSTNPADWKDLLYLSSPTTSQQIIGGADSILLQFSHAYCWVTIEMWKLTDKTKVLVQAISLETATSEFDVIKNKGTINPRTGEATGTIDPQTGEDTGAGPIKMEFNPTIDIPVENAGTPYEFNFLVPSFMNADIKDSDIVIRVTTSEDDSPKVLSFPFRKAHLNTDGTKYGFQKGMHNTYTLVYNNSSMYLSLEDWTTTKITESTLGEGMVNVKPKERLFFNLWMMEEGIIFQKLEETDHRLHSYLGEVVENNNGIYVDFTVNKPSSETINNWRVAVQRDPFQSHLYGATLLAAGGAQVAWKDEETGALLAKQACTEHREGGYTDWRLPRISECYILSYIADGTSMMNGKECWSGTEANDKESYAAVKFSESALYPKKCDKRDLFYVRCVRDFMKPKPQM